MKRIKHLLTTLLLIFCLSAFAEKVTINGVRYEIVTKGKAAIVIKSEAGDGGYSGNIIIPETVKYNGTTHNVADKCFF